MITNYDKAKRWMALFINGVYRHLIKLVIVMDIVVIIIVFSKIVHKMIYINF